MRHHYPLCSPRVSNPNVQRTPSGLAGRPFCEVTCPGAPHQSSILARINICVTLLTSQDLRDHPWSSSFAKKNPDLYKCMFLWSYICCDVDSLKSSQRPMKLGFSRTHLIFTVNWSMGRIRWSAMEIEGELEKAPTDFACWSGCCVCVFFQSSFCICERIKRDLRIAEICFLSSNQYMHLHSNEWVHVLNALLICLIKKTL